MTNIRYVITGWAMCLACLLMMSSCRIWRKTTERTELKRMEYAMTDESRTETGLEELMRRVREKEDIHVVWYRTEDTLLHDGRPPVKAEAWITRQKEEEDTTRTESVTVSERHEKEESITEEEEERKTDTKTSPWPAWWEIMLMMAGAGAVTAWAMRRR